MRARLLTPAAELRPWRSVPRPVLALLAAALAAQLAWSAARPAGEARVDPLPPAVSEPVIELAALGDRALAARLLTLWLQGFDRQAGRHLGYRHLDYGRLTAWLERLHALAPQSHYPLLLATRIYAGTSDPGRRRAALEFTYRTFLEDPRRFWRWLTEAALIAEYRLGDLELALKYARAIRREVPREALPFWAYDMEILLLEDLGEYQSAYVIVEGLIRGGQITDPDERRFLRDKLQALRVGGVEKRTQAVEGSTDR